MAKEECIFCRIIKGEIPSEMVFRNRNVVAFMDLYPTNPGHVLVVAREHSTGIIDAKEGVLAEMMAASKKIAKAVMKAAGSDGFNLHINNGRAAGQVVPHVHFHIIPRHEGDGLVLWRQGKYGEGEMKGWAERIKKALE